MHKLLKAALIVAGSAAAATAAAVYLSTPGKALPEQKKILYGRNVAHRGLHDRSGKCAENTLSAFRAAAEAGYGAEMDARLTADGAVVVFHDKHTGRLCGEDMCIEETDLDVLRTLRPGGGDEPIPTLPEALNAIGGSGIVILELKTAGRRNAQLCEKVLGHIRDYSGALCVESFDPRIVAWFLRNAPDILRGQLTDSFRNMKKGAPLPVAFAVSHGLTNLIARPQFIAHGPGKKSLLIRLAEKRGAMSVHWTARNIARQLDSDAVIFEHYRPLPRFK